MFTDLKKLLFSGGIFKRSSYIAPIIDRILQKIRRLYFAAFCGAARKKSGRAPHFPPKETIPLKTLLRQKRSHFAILCALVLVLCLTACQAGQSASAPQATPEPTAAPEATPTPAPEATPTPQASESPAPGTASDTESHAQSGAQGAEAGAVSVEVEAMYPLLQAHMLAILNGGTFDVENPAYFWQTVSFAIDGCGLDFYSAETVGNALMLSRGVVEEIASGLFETAGDLPEIPESLSGEIQYDADADAYSRPLSGGGYSVAVRDSTAQDDTLKLKADLISEANGQAVASFTAVLVPNTREGNSLLTYSIRSIALA